RRTRWPSRSPEELHGTLESAQTKACKQPIRGGPRIPKKETGGQSSLPRRSQSRNQRAKATQASNRSGIPGGNQRASTTQAGDRSGIPRKGQRRARQKPTR